MTAGAVLREATLRREGSPSLRTPRHAHPLGLLVVPAVLLTAMVSGAVLRLSGLNSLGYNSDEAVYAGQAASLAEQEEFLPYFPVFRAHPMLFQALLSQLFHGGVSDIAGRRLSAVLGLATILVVYLLGKELYGRAAGALAALLIAVVPYHVVVTRQVLLDGPMVLLATAALWCLARYARTQRPLALYAAAGTGGLAVLAKETSIVLLGAVYAFVALTPSLKIRLRHLLVAALVFGLTVIPFPISLVLAGRTKTGGSYLAWQLGRRANHGFEFYAVAVPPALGWLTILVAALGLWLLRSRGSWRETLLLCWIAVPTVFFQAWPTKGFQYLLPAAPAVVVLTARALAGAPAVLRERWPARRRLTEVAVGATALLLVATLTHTSWSRTQATGGATFLAGSGGVPGGREAGHWVRDHLPVGSKMLAVGPSMANILQFYGHRKTYGLSVSPNPLHRNPVYEPVNNPDLMIRHNDLQYLVWDSFSAKRSPFFSQSLLRYVQRYHGRVVHTERVGGTPVIVIYQVRP